MGKMRDLAKKALGRGVTAGREKIRIDALIRAHPEGVTITGFDFLTGKDGDSYPVFTFAEDNTKYFNGATALRKLVDMWLEEFEGDIDGCNATLKEEPVAVQLVKTVTNAGNPYVAVKVLD